MSLTQPNHDLKRDLQGIASDLKWSAVELIAERMRQSGHEADTQAVLKMITVFHAGEDRLAGYAVEVASGGLYGADSNSPKFILAHQTSR